MDPFLEFVATVDKRNGRVTGKDHHAWSVCLSRMQGWAWGIRCGFLLGNLCLAKAFEQFTSLYNLGGQWLTPSESSVQLVPLVYQR